MDPSSPTFANTFSLLSRVIQSNYPFHFGIVLITNFKSRPALVFARALTSLLRKSKFVTAIDFVKNVTFLIIKAFENSETLEIDKIVALYKRIDLKDSVAITANSHQNDDFLQVFYF